MTCGELYPCFIKEAAPKEVATAVSAPTSQMRHGRIHSARLSAVLKVTLTLSEMENLD